MLKNYNWYKLLMAIISLIIYIIHLNTKLTFWNWHIKTVDYIYVASSACKCHIDILRNKKYWENIVCPSNREAIKKNSIASTNYVNRQRRLAVLINSLGRMVYHQMLQDRKNFYITKQDIDAPAACNGCCYASANPAT